MRFLFEVSLNFGVRVTSASLAACSWLYAIFEQTMGTAD